MLAHNAMPLKRGNHLEVKYNVPPPGYVNGMPDGGVVDGKHNMPLVVNHSYYPGSGPHMPSPGPPQHQISPCPEATQPMDQSQMHRPPVPIQVSTIGNEIPHKPWTNQYVEPPPPYYSLRHMDTPGPCSPPGFPIYAGNHIPHPQQWPLHHQNASLPFSPQYPNIYVCAAGNFSPPPSFPAHPSRPLPPSYTFQSLPLSPQFYQPPMLPTPSLCQQHSFVPYPTLPQINPTLNHCNVHFNTQSGTPYPDVTAHELDGTVYYTYNGQVPQVTPPPLQGQTEAQHFNKLDNEVAASIVNKGNEETDGVKDAPRDEATVSNVPPYRRAKPRRQWKRKNN